MKFPFIEHIVSLMRKKDSRSVTLRNNIIASTVLRIVGLATSLLIVPVTLHYLKNEEYGIWLTISSILYWFSFFDIGLGNGMRNYLTEAISRNDFEKGRAYLSTTLVLLSGIAVVIAALLLIPLSFIDLSILFNTRTIINSELVHIMLIAIGFTLVLFVVKNVGYIFVALQHYALNDFLIVAGSVLSLVAIFFLTRFTEGNLLFVVLVFTTIPVLVYLLSSVFIFRHYPQLKPAFRFFDKALAKAVIGKGIGFFFIQITSCLIIYGSSNLFITRSCGPAAVTTYNIAYKYFNLLAIGYTVILSPLWNAYTDASVKNDWEWIQKSFRRSLKIWGLSLVVGIAMLISSNVFYHYWVGDSVMIPLSVSTFVLLYISFFNLNNCVTYLLNGLNKIHVQIITSVAFTGVYLIIVLLYGRSYGINGIVLCMSICYLMMGLIHLYQCYLLIQRKARGIWNK